VTISLINIMMQGKNIDKEEDFCYLEAYSLLTVHVAKVKGQGRVSTGVGFCECWLFLVINVKKT